MCRCRTCLALPRPCPSDATRAPVQVFEEARENLASLIHDYNTLDSAVRPPSQTDTKTKTKTKTKTNPSCVLAD